MPISLKSKNVIFGYFLVGVLLFLKVSIASSQSLPKNGPERKQLIAMGYEIDEENSKDTWTIARLGNSNIGFSKSNEKLIIIRSFMMQKKLKPSQELELLRLINRVNIDLAYQAVLNDDSLTFALYDYGDYNPKTFAKLVRLAEQANSVFTSYPDILTLLNDK
jgi:hypothetical protein